jgi:hypothetical protein
MNVADLFARETIVFSGRLTSALDQPAIGDKFLDALEAGDIMNLIEDGESQDFANTGDRTE